MERDTSTAALQAVMHKIKPAHEDILYALKIYPLGLTAHEIAKLTGFKPAFAQPRVSELHTMKRIEKSGERRKNDTGLSAAVWRIAA